MAATAPSLSFVIPTRNQARFIRRCIDSCLSQKIAGAEILVFDGASTDETRDILASYGDSIRWVSQRDRGQSDAINKGVHAARGDVVAWINSDDFYQDETVLARVLARFAKDARIDVVHGDGWFVDVHGTPFRRYRSRPVDGGRLLFAYPTAIVQPALFFRRSLFESVGGLREELHWAMDLDLWLRMLPAARRVEYLDEPLACIRCHEDAKTYRGMLQQIREVRQIKRQHVGAFGSNPLLQLSSAVADAKLYVYWAAVRLGLWKAA